jgi:YaiO family outer membrane protein
LKFTFLFLCLWLIFRFANAQSNLSSDELFKEARNTAFQQKNYPKAIALSKLALQKSPDYADIQIFLGRLYTWSDKTDSARKVFDKLLIKQPELEDASLASGSLEFWNNNSAKALQIVDSGLGFHPNSVSLLLLKAKVLNDLKRWPEANLVINNILKTNPNDTEARALASRIKDSSTKNKIGINYDFIYFDKQFDDPWHLTSIDYSRLTKIGSVIGRLNYANRFNSNGLQFEVDAYPHISKTFQAYVSGGYSNNIGVFPNYRAGFSLYANLPKSFEAEVGFRYLRFSDNTWIYTASVGKYYKSFWFNLRTFLTPSNRDLSRSVSFTTRYYFGDADDYFTARLGTGLSPDNPQINVLIQNNYKLISNNAMIGLRKSFKKFNVAFINVGLDNQEYNPNTKGNQLDIGIGYIRRF